MAKFAAKDSNKNITLSPHGTGKVVVGTGATDATVQSDGNHNLVLQTGNATTGSISITDGADGNIAITPDGTGEVDISKVDIDGGAIDAVTLGTNSAVTEAQIDNININGNAITSTDTDGNIDLTPNGTGEVNISKVDIDSGSIDGVTLGTSSGITEAQIDNININGNDIISSDTNGNINLTPNGAGEVNISKVDIDAGTIDGTTIATSNITVGSSKTLDVSAGTFTTSASQNQAIVSSGGSLSGGRTLDVSAGTFTTSASQNQTIVSSGLSDGMIVDRQYYKYTLSSNNSYDISTNSNTIITRTSGSDASVQNITIEPEYTYIYEFQIFQKLFRDNNTVGNRFFDCRLYEGTTDRSQGGTSVDTMLALGTQGRELASGSGAAAPTYGLFQYKGAIYYGSGATTTRYVYLAATSNDADKTLTSHFSVTYPCYLFITKIKGDKATDVT